MWKNTWQYKRIIDILEDYWLNEEDEESVFIHMEFKHKNGEKTSKDIFWENPNISKERQENEMRDMLSSLFRFSMLKDKPEEK